jgi:hypothetical protein
LPIRKSFLLIQLDETTAIAGTVDNLTINLTTLPEKIILFTRT